MTNIKQKTKQPNMHLHIEKAFVIIDKHLPSPYVEKVLSKMASPKPAKGYIRNVRARINDCHLNRIDIVNALLDVAKENQFEKEKLIQALA